MQWFIRQRMTENDAKWISWGQQMKVQNQSIPTRKKKLSTMEGKSEVTSKITAARHMKPTRWNCRGYTKPHNTAAGHWRTCQSPILTLHWFKGVFGSHKSNRLYENGNTIGVNGNPELYFFPLLVHSKYGYGNGPHTQRGKVWDLNPCG